MVNPILVNMLLNKIITAEVNPSTKEPFKLEDIKNVEYKTAVEAKLNATQYDYMKKN